MYAVNTTAPSRVQVTLRNAAIAPTGQTSPVVAPVLAMGQTSPVTASPLPVGQTSPVVAPAPVVAPPQTQMADAVNANAYAAKNFVENHNAFDAAAQGFDNAGVYRAAQAADKAKQEEGAKLLGDNPDLQHAVQSGVMDLGTAYTMAQQRDTLAKANVRKAQITDYLQKSGDTDIAGQYASGVLDEKGVADALAAKDKLANPAPTDTQKELDQINTERKAAGTDPLSLEDFLASKKGTAVDPTTGLTGDLPSVMLNEQGVPDPVAQKAFLDALDPQTATNVKAVADYSMDLTKIASLKSDQREKLAALVRQYDPTFSMTQYAARSKMINTITSGSLGQNLISVNTAIGHLNALEDAGTALHNSSGLMANLNPAGIAVKQLNHDPALKSFADAKLAVASEMAKVFKGPGVSGEAEIEAWDKQFDAASSPEELKAAVDGALHLMGSRVSAIQQQYASTMGKPGDFSFLSPASASILTKLGMTATDIDPNFGNPDAQTIGGATKAPPAAAPAAASSAAPTTAPDLSKVSNDDLLKMLNS